MEPRSVPSGKRAVALRSLGLDLKTAEVVTALRAAGVRPILLKGPVIARWLYADDPNVRPYVDIDLLVSPDDHPTAEAVLRRMGFSLVYGPSFRERPTHAESWKRPSDGASVDLHRALYGCDRVGRDAVWRAVTADAELITVGGVEMEVPSVPVRALHLALSLDPREGPGSKGWDDLERAVKWVPGPDWQQAVALARALGVDAEMGVKLRAVPGGQALADPLELPSRAPMHLLLQQHGLEALALGDFLQLPGWRVKLRFVAHKLFPPPDYMRQWSPVARRSSWGLAAAYAIRTGSVVGRLPKAVANWCRAARQRRRELE